VTETHIEESVAEAMDLLARCLSMQAALLARKVEGVDSCVG
jgi:hypothetical protein